MMLILVLTFGILYCTRVESYSNVLCEDTARFREARSHDTMAAALESSSSLLNVVGSASKGALSPSKRRRASSFERKRSELSFVDRLDLFERENIHIPAQALAVRSGCGYVNGTRASCTGKAGLRLCTFMLVH